MRVGVDSCFGVEYDDFNDIAKVSTIRKGPMADRSVLKALAILDTLGEADDGLTLSQLAELTGCPISTTHRLLKTLVSREYIEREPLSGRYLLGSKILRLQAARASRITVTRVAFPHLRELTRRVDETTNLSIFSDGRIVYLESLAADRAVGFYSPPGTLAPAHCTAMGKAMLAFLPESELDAWLAANPLSAATPKTDTDPAGLRRQLAIIRDQGFAIDYEEWVTGVRCVAAPVRDYSGGVVAAVSVTVPAGRLPVEREPAMVEAVMATARSISAGLGYSPAGLSGGPR